MSIQWRFLFFTPRFWAVFANFCCKNPVHGVMPCKSQSSLYSGFFMSFAWLSGKKNYWATLNNTLAKILTEKKLSFDCFDQNCRPITKNWFGQQKQAWFKQKIHPWVSIFCARANNLTHFGKWTNSLWLLRTIKKTETFWCGKLGNLQEWVLSKPSIHIEHKPWKGGNGWDFQ